MLQTAIVVRGREEEKKKEKFHAFGKYQLHVLYSYYLLPDTSLHPFLSTPLFLVEIPSHTA